MSLVVINVSLKTCVNKSSNIVLKFMWRTKIKRQLYWSRSVALANFVYGGWLGNTAPDDGYKYRGRDCVINRKVNFKKFGDLIGQDLVNNPKLASTDPKVMAKLAVAFYSQNKLLQSIKNGNSIYDKLSRFNGGKELPEWEHVYLYGLIITRTGLT